MEGKDVMKQARAKLGLTQEELAGLLPVSVHSVSQWETGQSTPKQVNALILDKVLKADGAVAEAFGYLDVNSLVVELRDQLDKLALAVRELLLIAGLDASVWLRGLPATDEGAQ